MTFIFSDQNLDEQYYKITAQSEQDAVLKALKKELDEEAISVEEICNNLDLELTCVDDLEEI